MNAKVYYQYLDTYRFIAVAQVILFHWLPTYFSGFPFAKLGVDMFFVLSGFLITEILIREKEQISKGKLSLKNALKVFYVRRALRIFPIYYILIVLIFFSGYTILKENVGYFLLYGVNYLIIKQGHWLDMLSHCWSLAVEEQFYLVWPMIILFFPYKYLRFLIPLLIIFSISYIIISEINKKEFYYVHLISCVSTLGAGSILAYLKNQNRVFKSSKYISLSFFISIALFITSRLLFSFDFLLHIAFLLFSFSFLSYLLFCENRFLNFLFTLPFITWLGKVSYGLYLYHNITPWLLRNLNGSEIEHRFTDNAILPIPSNGIQLFFMQSALLLLIVTISWYCIEKPMNAMKKYFNY